MFLKNRNIIFKMKISKVTDYAALKQGTSGKNINSHKFHKKINQSKTKWNILKLYVLDGAKTQSQQNTALKRNKYSFTASETCFFHDAAQIKIIIKLSEGWTCVINLQVKKRK